MIRRPDTEAFHPVRPDESDLAASTMAGWILGSMSSGIVAVDERGCVAMLNPGARRILGCQAAAAIGEHCRSALAAQPTVARLLLDALDGREALSRAELVLAEAPDRPASTIGFTLTPVRDDDGAVRGAAMIFRDLTPLERMDEQQRLRERLAALGQMAAGLAHEIRNPLAGMEVLAGLLKRRLAGQDEERSLVDQLIGELRSLAATVSDSLEFVRPLTPERGPVDPVALVEESLAIAQSRVAFDGAVERAFAEDPCPLEGDAEQLRDVLADLMVNAFEVMADDNGGRPRKLLLSVEMAPKRPGKTVVDGEPTPAGDTPREVVIRVGDSGPGVPADLREKIFYPFFTTKPRGSGVGLANGQKVAASHGGALVLESRPTGSSFCLHLPAEGGEKASGLAQGFDGADVRRTDDP